MIDAEQADGDAASRLAASISEPRTARLVDDRIGVGHRDHRAEPAGGRRRGAGVDVLLVLLAGGAQVDVRVDEAGNACLPVASIVSPSRRPAQRTGRAELRDPARPG